MIIISSALTTVLYLCVNVSYAAVLGKNGIIISNVVAAVSFVTDIDTLFGS